MLGRFVVKKIATDLLVERLADWGVDTVFGLPGDGINGIMEGLRRHQDRIRFVLVHHEEAAASWPPGTPRPPAGSGSAWPPPAPAASTC
jgi:glyoxylate carboligase